VVTNQDFITQLEEACWTFWNNMHNMYKNDNMVMELVKRLGDPIRPGIFDPRVQGGIGCVARKELPAFLGAPAVIFMAGNDKMSNPDLQCGICGQNMNLVAKSLGLGFCWSGFGTAVNFIPKIKSRLGFDNPWRVISALCIGYPKFKQEGIVPRHYRPVQWFRPGKNEPEVEERINE
jgi:nitroreductase